MKFNPTIPLYLFGGLVVGISLLSLAEDEAPEPNTSEALFESLDANKDGKLTKDEVGEERARYFNRLARVGDNDEDGVLTKEEFIAASEAAEPGIPPNRPQFGRGASEMFFNRMDTNGDGKITVAESPEQVKRMVKGLLARAGKGEDGSLTREEFQRHASRPALPPVEGRAQGIGFLRILDGDRDGKLSKEELAKAVEQFVKLDRDGDGHLDLRELSGFPQMGDLPQDTERFVAGLMQRYDANKDGKLAGKEISDLSERAKARVKDWDKNRDGEVTKEEISATFRGFERSRQGSDRPSRPNSDN